MSEVNVCQAPNKSVFYQAVGYLTYHGYKWEKSTGSYCLTYYQEITDAESIEDQQVVNAYLVKIGIVWLSSCL